MYRTSAFWQVLRADDRTLDRSTRTALYGVPTLCLTQVLVVRLHTDVMLVRAVPVKTC